MPCNIRDLLQSFVWLHPVSSTIFHTSAGVWFDLLWGKWIRQSSFHDIQISFFWTSWSLSTDSMKVSWSNISSILASWIVSRWAWLCLRLSWLLSSALFYYFFGRHDISDIDGWIWIHGHGRHTCPYSWSCSVPVSISIWSSDLKLIFFILA